jgi:hypothetical protein
MPTTGRWKKIKLHMRSLSTHPAGTPSRAVKVADLLIYGHTVGVVCITNVKSITFEHFVAVLQYEQKIFYHKLQGI